MPFLPFEPAPPLARLFAAIKDRRRRNRREVVVLGPVGATRAEEIIERREFDRRVADCKWCGPGQTLCSAHYTEFCARNGASV